MRFKNSILLVFLTLVLLNFFFVIEVKIPEDREIIYIEEIKEGFKIGKPRFKNPKYQ